MSWQDFLPLSLKYETFCKSTTHRKNMYICGGGGGWNGFLVLRLLASLLAGRKTKIPQGCPLVLGTLTDNLWTLEPLIVYSPATRQIVDLYNNIYIYILPSWFTIYNKYDWNLQSIISYHPSPPHYMSSKDDVSQSN